MGKTSAAPKGSKLCPFWAFQASAASCPHWCRYGMSAALYPVGSDDADTRQCGAFDNST